MALKPPSSATVTSATTAVNPTVATRRRLRQHAEHEQRPAREADRAERDHGVSALVHAAILREMEARPETRLHRDQPAQLATAAGRETAPIRSIMCGSAA